MVNWLNLGIVVWMFILAGNILFVSTGLLNANANNYTGCFPSAVKGLYPAGSSVSGVSGSSCAPTDPAQQVTVATASNETSNDLIGLFVSLATSFVGFALNLIPGVTIIGSFINNFIFGYVQLFQIYAAKFPDMAVVFFLVGGLIFTIQLMSGFFLLFNLILAFGNKK